VTLQSEINKQRKEKAAAEGAKPAAKTAQSGKKPANVTMNVHAHHHENLDQTLKKASFKLRNNMF